MKLRHASPTFAVACLALVFAGCGKKDAPGASDQGETVATINGEAISAKDFYNYLIHKSRVIVSGPQGQTVADMTSPVGFQGMRDIIDRTIIEQIAKDESVLPTDADVQKEIAKQDAKSPGAIEKAAEKNGLSMDEIKEEIRFNLARENVLTKGVTVGASEVDTYIKENPKQFSTPPTASLMILEVKSPAKKAKADAALAAHKPFKDVVKEFSDNPNSKLTGGEIPAVNPENFQPKFRDAIAKTDANHATAWIDVPQGSVKFFVISKAPEKPMTLTPEIKEDVHKKLLLERGSQTNNLQDKILAKLKSSSIDINIPSIKPEMAQFLQQVKAAPAPGQTGAMPAPSPTKPGASAPKAGAPATPKATTPHF